MAGFGSIDTAAKLRDLIRRIATREINTLRPEPRIGRVYSINTGTKRAMVLFAGETTDSLVSVSFGDNMIPQRAMAENPSMGLAAPGDVIRVSGRAGRYYISEFLSGSPVSTGQIETFARKGLLYYPEDYGAVGDGVTNDTQALQDCIDACAAANGGYVVLTYKYRWTGQLKFKKWVGAFGFTKNRNDQRSVLVAGDSSAQLCIGQWGGNEHVALFSNFTVDGNNTGNSEGLVKIEAVTGSLEHMTILDAVGAGLYLNAAQNIHFNSVDVFSCGKGVLLDDGAGGCLFSRCEIASNQIGIHIYDSAETNAYPYGPAHNTFLHCIVETYVPSNILLKAEAGANNHFVNCGFSVNNVSMSSGDQVQISNPIWTSIPTLVMFHSCNFNGGSGTGQKYTTVHLVGNNYCYFTGVTYIQQSTNTFVQDSGTGVFSFDTQFFWGTNTPVATRMTAINGGSTISHAVTKEAMISLEIPPNAPTTAFAIKDATLAGGNFFITKAGDIGWQPGDSYTTVGSLGYSATHETPTFYLGATVQGRFKRHAAADVFPNGAITIDSKAGNFFKYFLAGAGNISSMTITNPSPDARLTIYIAWDATGGQNVTWATNILWPNGVAPTDKTANTVTVVELIYDDAATKWIATSVAVRIPASGGPYPTGEPAVYQYSTAQTHTALAIPVGAKTYHIRGSSAGGGGGAGMRGPAASIRCGGGAGGGGGTFELEGSVADLGVSTLYITVGTGGPGATGQGTNGTAGAAGTAGGASSVKTSTAADAVGNILALATGGGAGGGGGAGVAGAAGAGGIGHTSGANGGQGAAAGTVGTNGSAAVLGTVGGGGGGGLTAANAQSTGGNGYAGPPGKYFAFLGVGAAGGGNGPSGANPVGQLYMGGSGGGGGSNAAGAGGNGGNGARGAGGGGGGASVDGSTSGAGGNGGDGFVEVAFYF